MYVVAVVRTYDYYTQIVSELRTKKLDIESRRHQLPSNFLHFAGPVAQGGSHRNFQTGEKQVFEARSGGKEDLGSRNEDPLSCDPKGKCPHVGWKTDFSSQ